MRPIFVLIMGIKTLFKGFFCILIFLQIQFAENPFRDVPLDHFAYTAIEKLIDSVWKEAIEDYVEVSPSPQ